jgi:hypothetical protein
MSASIGESRVTDAEVIPLEKSITAGKEPVGHHVHRRSRGTILALAVVLSLGVSRVDLCKYVTEALLLQQGHIDDVREMHVLSTRWNVKLVKTRVDGTKLVDGTLSYLGHSPQKLHAVYPRHEFDELLHIGC